MGARSTQKKGSMNDEPLLTDKLEWLRKDLEQAWGTDTAVKGPPSSLPSAGQCAVTAMVVHDHLGGTYVSAVIDGVSHWFNCVRFGKTWVDVDLTGDQFGRGPIQIAPAGTLYQGSRTRSAKELNDETVARYQILRGRLAR